MPSVDAHSGQRGVVQVVRTGPDVEEDQRPEVQDREPVAEDRALGGLRQEVVHQAEERRRQEEGDGVVAVPPLHEGVLHAGVDAVALERPGRDGEVVEDVQDRDGDDRRDVEPDRDVEVPLAPLGQRHEEVDREDDPDHRDRDVDRPLELGVFLALREAERQRDRGRDDDRLPAPEVDPAQAVAPHARLEQPLRRVVDAREERVAGEREDHGVRVQRAAGARRSAAIGNTRGKPAPPNAPLRPASEKRRGRGFRWSRRGLAAVRPPGSRRGTGTLCN